METCFFFFFLKFIFIQFSPLPLKEWFIFHEPCLYTATVAPYWPKKQLNKKKE